MINLHVQYDPSIHKFQRASLYNAGIKQSFIWQLQVDLKQFEGMAVQHARKNKEEEESDLDLKNRRGPKAPKDKPIKEVHTAELHFLLPSGFA